MKNKEKYKDILMDYALGWESFALTKEGKIGSCNDILCGECVWDDNYSCRSEKLKWLDEECAETDWSKVEVDTKIYVGQTLEEVEAEAFPRYFAKYEGGRVYAYSDGCSSWTAEGPEDVISWECAKLAEDA